MDKRLPNFENLSGADGKIYGRYNTVTSVNPYKCKFIATYPDGKIIHGKDLFTTGWDNIPNGLSKLEYVLSTGHFITIPKFNAYLPLIETSIGIDGSRIFHAINVKCMTDKDIIIYRIVLREDARDKYKIGDIIIGREPMVKEINNSWKFTS